MNIINSVTGLNMNLNFGEINNPRNIIIQRINYNNEEDDDEEGEEEEDDEEEEEEEDDEEEEEEEEDDDNEENENNENYNSLIDENNENDINVINGEEQIYLNKRKKFISELNEFQYKNIKKYSEVKEKKCSICLQKYKGFDIIKEFPCKHIYHKNCILKWLKESNICPLCKYDISSDINNIEINQLINDEEEEDN